MTVTRYLIKVSVFASKKGDPTMFSVSESTYESDSATIFRIPQAKLFAEDVELNMTMDVVAIRTYKESTLNRGMIELENETKIGKNL